MTRNMNLSIEIVLKTYACSLSHDLPSRTLCVENWLAWQNFACPNMLKAEKEVTTLHMHVSCFCYNARSGANPLEFWKIPFLQPHQFFFCSGNMSLTFTYKCRLKGYLQSSRAAFMLVNKSGASTAIASSTEGASSEREAWKEGDQDTWSITCLIAASC